MSEFNEVVHVIPNARKYHYIPSRGGHAPFHLRKLLLDFVGVLSERSPKHDSIPPYKAFAEVDGYFYNDKMQARWDSSNARARALWVIGRLWNCTDILYAFDCRTLGLPECSTYAQAVRQLKAGMTEEEPMPAA